MASRLWLKPDNRHPTTLCDLFDDVSLELQMEFTRWDQQLSNFEWKHRFLHYRNHPIKCELTSARFDNIGNEYFEQREWRKAMEMYNQALCFAESGSSNLGILYAKRGFCFTNMKMYGAGMEDIDMALANNLSPDWVAECRQITEIFQERSKPFEPLIPKLSFECDAQYSAMANVLELKFDGNERAYIVAKADIDVGKTILVEESFVAITNCYDKTCCATCLKEMRNFIPCQKCTDAVFCNTICMQQNHLHQISCGENFHRMPTPIKFVVQSILKAISTFPNTQFFMQFVQVYIGSLNAADAAAKFKMRLNANMQNYGLFLKQKFFNALPMVTVYQAYTTLLSMPLIAKRFNSQSKKRFLMHLVGHHTMILNSSGFGGFEVNQNRFISATLANLVSLFEHSCTPNVVHFAHGSREVCITIRPIRAGEPLCYDYDNDGSQDKDDSSDEETKLRKQMLWDNWRIDCKCRKCCVNDEIKPNPRMAADPVFAVLNYKSYLDDNLPTLELFKSRCIHFLNKFKDEPWTKEMEAIIKAYSQCILDEYNFRYGPSNSISIQ